MPRLVLKIKGIKIFIEDGDIKNVNLGGREDIFEHPDVKHFLEKRDGKVIQISGDFQLNGRIFDFKVGYSMKDGLGTIIVRKKGQKTGDLTIIKDAFNFLYSLYNIYFIEI